MIYLRILWSYHEKYNLIFDKNEYRSHERNRYSQCNADFYIQLESMNGCRSGRIAIDDIAMFEVTRLTTGRVVLITRRIA